MIIAVASGKGGTGKTTIATSLALTLVTRFPVRLLDCDVEAPNAHLLLNPVLTQRRDATIPIPVVDKDRCVHCGVCAQVCQYNAIAVTKQQVLIFPDMCHGCGSCTLNCAWGAIHETPHTLGVLESGDTAEGIRFARGALHIGQSWAIPVIHQLKHWLPDLPDEITIIDAPPGTSCPVAESIKDADFVLLVTEPTPFGLHDLKLAYELTLELGLPAGVIINRDGVGDQGVTDFCAQAGLPVLMRIPMDREIAVGIAQGIPLVHLKPEYRPHLEHCAFSLVGASL